MLPAAIDFRRCSVGTENQIGMQSDQTKTSADFASFDRLQKEIAAFRNEQFAGGTDRSLRVGNNPSPDERMLTRSQQVLRAICAFKCEAVQPAFLSCCRRAACLPL